MAVYLNKHQSLLLPLSSYQYRFEKFVIRVGSVKGEKLKPEWVSRRVLVYVIALLRPYVYTGT